MLQTDITGEPIIVLKAEPSEAQALRAAHSDVTPGYHMNKRHWITLHPDGSLEAKHVHELVTESYALVVAGLPKPERPIDPETFGRKL